MSDFPPPGPPPPPGAPPPGEPAAPPQWGPAAPQQWGPAPPPQPGFGAPPPPGWTPERGMLGAAHKPGAMPLRPLSLGEIYDAAFRIIRFNPKATVGSAVLVAAIAMAIPVLLVGVLTWTVGLTYDPSATEVSDEDAIGYVVAYGSYAAAAILQGLGLILVTGMVVHVTAAAAVGKRLTLGEAWAATHGRRWRLVGLALVLALATTLILAVYAMFVVLVVLLTPTVAAVLLIIFSVPVLAAFMSWFWIRVYYLPVPALMLEDLGVVSSIGRGYRLSLGGFWRIFGIALLTVVIGAFAGQLLGLPFSIGGTVGSLTVDEDLSLFVTILGTALAQVATTAFVAPFTSTVTSLQYLDQRMRKEAYDVELMRQAGVLGS
ncbi:hypothetical protein [Nocardioides sp.]|uniref:hypothetical protein n=1 Tax=Nocardioides sp. TaxID=35761 RepID=UPI002717D1A6|nr:hypothetical protein [Nocardioides sp.]MDO9456821.1 hypothetical protein [Nocardioides sp.]